jgi:hypothetical protein
VAFSCGARSAFKLKETRLLEKHAIAPSPARLCWIAPGWKQAPGFRNSLTLLKLNRKRITVELHDLTNNIRLSRERFTNGASLSANPFLRVIQRSHDKSHREIARNGFPQMIGEKISTWMVGRPSRQMVFITFMASDLRLKEVLPTTKNKEAIRSDFGASPSDIL